MASTSEAKMNTSPETVYTAMKDLGFELTLHDLKCPTEKFMLNTIIFFLKHLSVDVDAVMKPAFDQLELFRTNDIDNLPILPIINLCEAFKGVGKHIFIRDFTIYDITNPGAKRTRKILKMVANFMLYMRSTIEKMQPEIDEVLNIGKKITELNNETEKMNENMNERAIQMAEKEKKCERVKRQIEQIKLQIAEEKTIAQQRNDKAQKIKQRLQEKAEKNREKQKKLLQTEETTKRLQQKVVENPESLYAELEQKKKNIEEKKEKLELLQIKIDDHKVNIKESSDAIRIIEKMREMLPEVKEVSKENIKKQEELDQINLQIKELESSIQHLAVARTRDIQNVTENDIIQLETETLKDHKRNQLKADEIKASIKKADNQIDNYCKRESELEMKTILLQQKIAEVEEDNKNFLAHCQALKNEEVRKMRQRHDNARSAVNHALELANNLEDAIVAPENEHDE